MLRGTAREAAAEFFGTFILIAFGVGVVAQTVLSKNANGSVLSINIGWGLAVMLGIYASAGVSGAHLNPAVTLGLVVGKRFPASDAWAYIAAQLIGAVLGAGVLFLIASGKAGFDLGTTPADFLDGHGLVDHGRAEQIAEDIYAFGVAFVVELRSREGPVPRLIQLHYPRL